MMIRTSLSAAVMVGCLFAAASACDAQTSLQVIREDVDDLFHASELFRENSMELDVATVSRVLRDDSETVVWLNATFDGLPVFYHDHGYSFGRDRSLARAPGSDEPLILGGPLPPADAFPTEREPAVSKEAAVEVWLGRARATPRLGGSFGSESEPEVTLGFHNIKLGTGQSPVFRLVWRVRDEGGKHPVAMVSAIDASILFFDSGIRSGGPIRVRPSPGNSPAAGSFDPTGAWTGGRCSDRPYPRELRLSSDKTFTATDLVSPCPPGKACIWSGIVHHSGTWSMRNDAFVELTPKSRENKRGAPLATALHIDVASNRLIEATPGSVMNCFYDRADGTNSRIEN